MTGQAAMWNIMRDHVPRKRWLSIGEIFSIVESRSTLDKDDLEVNAMNFPRWKMNVCRTLMEKKKTGDVRGRKR
jgi:hypothetical protein